LGWGALGKRRIGQLRCLHWRRSARSRRCGRRMGAAGRALSKRNLAALGRPTALSWFVVCRLSVLDSEGALKLCRYPRASTYHRQSLPVCPHSCCRGTGCV
jgi:hypothetical protein